MWLEYIRMAIRALTAHRFRSTLTVLSITIGAFSIVLMSSLAESGLTTLARGIEDLGGARLVDIVLKKPERMDKKLANYTHGLTVADRDVLFASLPHVSERAMLTPSGRQEVVADNGEVARTDVVGGDGGFLDLFRMRIHHGRAFSEDENRAHAKVCVVGAKVAKKLWGGDAVGHTLMVAGIRCQVIGQLTNTERMGINFGFDWLDVTVLPLDTYGDVNAAAVAGAELLIKTDKPESNEVVKRIANALLVERHHNVDDFQIFDFRSFMDKFHAMFRVMETIVGFVAGIALLVGGIGVMNMMLVSVSERVREIGIRKALGASPAAIASQFIIEAMVLSGTGGLVGVVAGIFTSEVVAVVIRKFTQNWVGVLAHNAIISALLVSFGIGVLFGFFPARRASRLDPVLAMRR